MAAAKRLFLGWGATVTLAVTILWFSPATVSASDLPNSDKLEDQDLTQPNGDGDQNTLQRELLLPPPAGPAEVSDVSSSPEARGSGASPSFAVVSTDEGSKEEKTTEEDAAGSERLDVAAFENDAATTVDGAATTRSPRWSVFGRRGPRSRHQGLMSRGRRVLILIIFLFFAALSGAIFCGYKPVADMLAEEGAYGNLCSLNSAANGTTVTGNLTNGAASSDGITNNGTLALTEDQGLRRLYQCTEQEAYIEGLYTYALTTACVVSAMAGPLLDAAGPRAAHITGSIVGLLGLVLFAIQHYPLGLMLLTAGQETAFLATLPLARLFPRSRSAVLGALGALASLSALVPVALRELRRALGTSVQSVMLGYAVAVGVPALLAGITFLPSRSAEMSDEISRHTTLASLQNAEGERPARDARACPLLQRPLHIFRRALQAIRRLWTHPVLRDALFSRRFMYILFIFTIAGLSSSFFIQGASRIFPGTASRHLDIFFPMAALPCALLGLIPDRWGSPVAIALLGISGLTMNLVSFGTTPAAGYVGVIALTMYISALTSQVHWYTAEAFPSEHSGTISGAILMVGGLISLLANPLYSVVTLETFHGDTRQVRAGLGILQASQLLLVYLAYREIRRHNGLPAGRDRGISRRRRRRRSLSLAEDPRIQELPED